jgi:fatty-acid desaturase
LRQGFLPLSGGPEGAQNFPWERPWWKPAPGGWPTLGYLFLIHIAALAGLILFPLPGWGVFFTAFGLAWLGGMGTTIAYHRSIAHRSLQLNPVARQFLTFFAPERCQPIVDPEMSEWENPASLTARYSSLNT